MLILYYFTFIYLLFLTFINKILVLLFCNRSIIFSLHLEVNGFAVFHSAFHSSRQKNDATPPRIGRPWSTFSAQTAPTTFVFFHQLSVTSWPPELNIFEDKQFYIKKRRNLHSKNEQIRSFFFFFIISFLFFFSMETRIINILFFFFLLPKGIKIFNVASLLPSVPKFYHLTSIANDTFPSLLLN